MDGENTTMYTDHIHARSLDSGPHPSRNWVKGLWSTIGYLIPEGFRICGENLDTVHTIQYSNLNSYFYMFSIWNEKNTCLSWDDTIFWAGLLNLHTVSVFYDDIFDEEKIRKSFPTTYDGNETEGYVIRLADEFTYGQFKNSVAKFVRKDFIPGHGHWTKQKRIRNELKK